MNDFERVANVIRHLNRHHTEQPDATDRLGNFRALAVARGAQTPVGGATRLPAQSSLSQAKCPFAPQAGCLCHAG